MPIAAAVFVAFLTVTAQSTGSVGAAADIAAARGLYAEGAYEEALTRLSAVRDNDPTGEAAKYRALCLLALGRTAEAERSLEDLFRQQPLLKLSEAEVAPRLVAMFHAVRKRLLPGAVKGAYAKAQTSFKERLYTEASSRFTTMLTLIADEDLAEEAASLSDLKMLGEGFLQLAEAEVAEAAKADLAARSAEVQRRTMLAGPVSSVVYSSVDTDVVAPVELVRRMPPWQPPATVEGRREYRGLLRIVVDERGAVESARMLTPLTDSYDELLIGSTQLWRYKPANRGGQDVKYALVIEVTLKGR